ncbi:hypothetical protein [Helicovermis profundi]|uniref:Uncharacterized protein n=1 Tax=Helicovermis profundi TaxID=3065157 RepID=A0AAU9EH83_9FIRM|nr:hypothetical protein HLPR_11490 [Clostridia bacterium S502]
MIIFSVNNNEEVITFPIEPNDIPIEKQYAHTKFSTFQDGDLTLINKNSGLKVVTINSFFPEYPNKYSFQERNSLEPKEYIDFFNKWSEVPLRIYITDKFGKEKLNMPCVITSFTYSEDKAKDTIYNLSVQEFKFVGEL